MSTLALTCKLTFKTLDQSSLTPETGPSSLSNRRKESYDGTQHRQAMLSSMKEEHCGADTNTHPYQLLTMAACAVCTKVYAEKNPTATYFCNLLIENWYFEMSFE